MSKERIVVTLTALQGGLPSAATVAGADIAGWIDTLQGNPNFSGITSELENLRDLLGDGATDTGAIADSLGSLGRQTTEASYSATPDSQDYLRQLGQNLRDAAMQLS